MELSEGAYSVYRLVHKLASRYTLGVWFFDSFAIKGAHS